MNRRDFLKRFAFTVGVLGLATPPTLEENVEEVRRFWPGWRADPATFGSMLDQHRVYTLGGGIDTGHTQRYTAHNLRIDEGGGGLALAPGFQHEGGQEIDGVLHLSNVRLTEVSLVRVEHAATWPEIGSWRVVGLD
jgi:hypothetical protein